MAVLCEALSVLVPVEALIRAFPGGPSQYEQLVPNATLCSDGVLTRVGFMHPNDVGVWIERLEDIGLTFIRKRPDGSAEAVDFVVLDQLQGPTCDCPWISTEVVDGIRWAWLTQYDKGDLATPVGWVPQNSAGLKFHPNEEVAGMVIARGELMDESVNMDSGATEYIGRPFERERSYDEAIRFARVSFELEDFREAYRQFRGAEALRELDDEDKILTAMSSYELCLQGTDDARALGSEAARRWREIVQLDIGKDKRYCRFALARSEGFAGNWDQSAACLEQSLELDPEDPYVLAERAFVAVVRGEPLSVPATYMRRAVAAASKRSDDGAFAYIDAIKTWNIRQCEAQRRRDR